MTDLKHRAQEDLEESLPTKKIHTNEEIAPVEQISSETNRSKDSTDALQHNFEGVMGRIGIVSGFEVDDIHDPMKTKGKNGQQTMSTTSRKKRGTSAFGGTNLKRTKDNYDEITLDYLNNPQSFIDSYTSFKFKNQFYHVGENLIIKSESDITPDLIGKLIRIIRPKKLDPSKILAFLEI
mmetsp:Transcript_8783/g.7757  ORF Transcript_8783/g.7757 Transcript_8783/m.7757 type:complete len:180 (+) Transcript_8783:69-608(+)